MTTDTDRIVEGDEIRIYANFEESADPIQWQRADADPDAGWSSTPYQVADANHDRGTALRMVNEWLDAQAPW